jgi:hypothetical protein
LVTRCPPFASRLVSKPGDDRVPVPRMLREPDAVANGRPDQGATMGNPVRTARTWQDGPQGGECLEHALRELPGGAPLGLFDESGRRELAGAVGADEETGRACGGLRLGDVDAKEPDRVARGPLPLRPVALDAGQAGKAFAGVARSDGAKGRIAAGTGQGRPRRGRDRWPKSREAGVSGSPCIWPPARFRDDRFRPAIGVGRSSNIMATRVTAAGHPRTFRDGFPWPRLAREIGFRGARRPPPRGLSRSRRSGNGGPDDGGASAPRSRDRGRDRPGGHPSARSRRRSGGPGKSPPAPSVRARWRRRLRRSSVTGSRTSAPGPGDPIRRSESCPLPARQRHRHGQRVSPGPSAGAGRDALGHGSRRCRAHPCRRSCKPFPSRGTTGR